jgi:hypothetical protein
MRALIILSTLAALSCPALASPAVGHSPAPQSLFVYGGGVGARLPGAEDGYGQALEAYGYDVGRGFMMGAYGFAAYRGAPIADLGVSAEYTYMHNGHPSGKDIAMRTHTRQVGAYVRPRLAANRYLDFGVRLEAGYVFSSTVLRQQALAEASPYTRIQAELMVGGRYMGAHLHVGHIQVHQRDHFRPYAPPDLAGVQLGVGLYIRR